jgi:hypothetical protein
MFLRGTIANENSDGSDTTRNSLFSHQATRLADTDNDENSSSLRLCALASLR